MSEVQSLTPEQVTAKQEFLRVAGLVTVPLGKDEAGYRKAMSEFVESVLPDAAVQIVGIYNDLVKLMLGSGGRSLVIARGPAGTVKL